jgi:hypothetical protein
VKEGSQGKEKKPYSLNDLNQEQSLIAYVVLQKLKEWFDLGNRPEKEKVKFKPLRMTVMGQAGAGKTMLINTLITTVRNMTKINKSIHVATPTGAMAFAVQGHTIHRLFKVDPKNMDRPMSEEEKKYVKNELEPTLVILIDERSLVGQLLLGKAEINASQCAHGYGHSEEDWGGIPIVIIMGDDYQLPPVLTQGAFYCFTAHGHSYVGSAYNGQRQFLQFGKTVMEITQIMRQDETETEFRPLLQNIRTGETTDKDREIMLSLHMSNFTAEERIKIRKGATYVFANRVPMQRHNFEKLKEQQSEDNPVARICARAHTWNGKVRQGRTAHFTQNDTPYICNMCRGAKVKIYREEL